MVNFDVPCGGFCLFLPPLYWLSYKCKVSFVSPLIREYIRMCSNIFGCWVCPNGRPKTECLDTIGWAGSGVFCVWWYWYGVHDGDGLVGSIAAVPPGQVAILDDMSGCHSHLSAEKVMHSGHHGDDQEDTAGAICQPCFSYVLWYQ